MSPLSAMTKAKRKLKRAALFLTLVSMPLSASASANDDMCRWQNRAKQPPQISTLLELMFQLKDQKFYPLDVAFLKRHFATLQPGNVPFKLKQGGGSTRERVSISYVYPSDADEKARANFNTLHSSQFWPFIRATLNANPDIELNRVSVDVTKEKNSSAIFSFYHFDQGDDVRSAFKRFKKNNPDILSSGKVTTQSSPGCLVSTVSVGDRIVAASAFYAPQSPVKSSAERAGFAPQSPFKTFAEESRYLSCRETFFASMWGFRGYAFQDPRSFHARPAWANEYDPKDYIWKYRKFQDLIRRSSGLNAQALCERLLPEIAAQ